MGDNVLIADKWSPDGTPALALVMAVNPARATVVKVKYLASRTAAWVARDRALGPAPTEDSSADDPTPEPATKLASPPGPPHVPPAPLALLDRPDVQDLLDRFLNRRKASTIEAYRKDLAYFAAWLGLPQREAVARLLACDQGQANRLLDH